MARNYCSLRYPCEAYWNTPPRNVAKRMIQCHYYASVAEDELGECVWFRLFDETEDAQLGYCTCLEAQKDARAAEEAHE